MARTVAATTVLAPSLSSSPGQPDCAGRQAGQQLVRRALGGAVEVGAAELVGGQRDGGLRVGHPQQRFGQAHQRQALGAADRVFAQQRLHRPERRRLVAHRLHPGPGGVDHGRPVQTAGGAQAGEQGLHTLQLVTARWRQQGRGGQGGGGSGWRCRAHGGLRGLADAQA